MTTRKTRRVPAPVYRKNDPSVVKVTALLAAAHAEMNGVLVQCGGLSNNEWGEVVDIRADIIRLLQRVRKLAVTETVEGGDNGTR